MKGRVGAGVARADVPRSSIVPELRGLERQEEAWAISKHREGAIQII